MNGEKEPENDNEETDRKQTSNNTHSGNGCSMIVFGIIGFIFFMGTIGGLPALILTVVSVFIPYWFPSLGILDRYIDRKNKEDNAKKQLDTKNNNVTTNGQDKIDNQENMQSSSVDQQEGPTKKQLKKIPHCPKCKSTNVQVIGNHRKGFSVGKAVVGGVLTGGVGTLAGFAGKKGKKTDMICMNCGKKFKW